MSDELPVYTTGTLIAWADKIDRRLGPISGRDADALARLLRATATRIQQLMTDRDEQDRALAEASRARSAEIKVLADRFLMWPLPKSVRSDRCVTMDYAFPRSGTNLLTADEARQMLEYLFGFNASDTR